MKSNSTWTRLFGSGFLTVLAATFGCSSPHEPLKTQDISFLKAGVTTLAEAEKILGPSHSPSSAQLASIANVTKNMPPQIKANADRDKTVAWGDEKRFVVGIVNESGKIWVTSYVGIESGSTAPTPPMP